jgi:hypothetical protein
VGDVARGTVDAVKTGANVVKSVANRAWKAAKTGARDVGDLSGNTAVEATKKVSSSVGYSASGVSNEAKSLFSNDSDFHLRHMRDISI